MRQPGKVFGPAAWVTSAMIGIALLAVLMRVYGVPVSATLAYLGGTVIFVYLPGRAFLSFFRRPFGRLENAVLSLALGLGATVVLHKFARMAGAEWVYGAGLAVCGAVVFRLILKRPPRRADFEFRATPAGMGFVFILALVLGLLAADTFRNGRSLPDGSVVVNMHYFDGLIRLSVIRELTHSVPPQMPFAAGIPLTYHYGMDLFIQIFHRYLGLGIFDLTQRLTMVFFLFLLAAVVFVFQRGMFRSEAAGVLGSFLVIFGSGGLTWAAALFLGTPLGGNPFFAFYLFDVLGLNSFFPALALVFAGAFALVRGVEGGGKKDLALAALLFALSGEFKMFLLGPLMAALVVTGLMAFLRFRDRRILAAGALTAAFSAPLIMTAIISNGGGLGYVFSIRLIEWPARMLENLDFARWAAAWEHLFHSPGGSLGDAGVAAAAVGLLLLGSFGWSLAALPGAIRDFFAFRKDRLARLFLAGLLGAALADFFLLHLTIGGEGRDILDIYVYYMGLAVLLVFAADRAVRTLRARKPFILVIGAAMLVILSGVNSAWFVSLKMKTPDPIRFTPQYLEMAAWLTDNTPPSSVILQPTDTKFVPYFAARRVVLDDTANSYLAFHLTRDELSLRRDAINRFFNDPSRNPDALGRYGVTHVLIYNEGRFLSWPGKEWSVPGFVMRPAFRNGNFTIYSVEKSNRPE